MAEHHISDKDYARRIQRKTRSVRATDDFLGSRVMGVGTGEWNSARLFVVQAGHTGLETKVIINNEERQGGRDVCDQFREHRLH